MSDGDLINKAWADVEENNTDSVFIILYEEHDIQGFVVMAETHNTLESAKASSKCIKYPNKLLAIKEITYQEGEGLEA